MNNALNAFRVGLVVILALGVGIYFFASSRKSTLTDENSIPYFAYLTDASGINAKSLITVAGLQVGEIQSVTLTTAKFSDVISEESDIPEGQNLDEIIRVARVDMRIIKSVRIPDDSWLKKESLGLLGAKALFLDLGNSAVDIEKNGQVTNVRSDTGMDVIFKKLEGVAGSIEKIASRLEEDLVGITKDIKGITGTLARFVEGDGDNPPLDELYSMVITDVRRVVKTINKAVGNVDTMVVANDQAVKELLSSLAKISGDVEDLVGTSDADGGTEGDIRQSLSSVRQITDDLAVVTASFKEILGENEGEFSDGVKQLKHTLTELNGTLTNLSEITGRIEDGEGSIGKLLTDEHMADKLEAAVVGASEYVTSLTSIEAHIDLGTYYSLRRGGSNVNFQLRIQPKPDKYYLIEIVDDGGAIERLTRTITTNEDVNGQPAQTEREIVAEDQNQVRITAMFAKKFWGFLVLRAGLIETSGGVGADLFFWDDRIHLRADLFNFGGPRNHIDGTDALRFQGGFIAPRLRSWIKFQPVPFIYAMAGVDDLLNFGWGGPVPNPEINAQGYGIDVFFGVGIAFKDDDLRSILPFIPSF
ncbi:MAG: MCE family protein [Deltaproteobacteria bacterium]|nr:MCE family protein [Deltaproteobacteria bacterium]